MDAQRPQPTDLDQRLIALRRKAAGNAPKRTERPERPSTAKKIAPSAPSSSADPSEDFSRRLKISSAAGAPAKPSGKLYNPDREPGPARRMVDVEQHHSEAGSSSYASRKEGPSAPSRQLFDYRKDDPVRFSVKQRPPPPSKPSGGDYVSAASASSYAPSQASTYTLSSSTDGSSASGLFDRNAKEAPPTNLVTTKLKKLYREITEGENKVKSDEVDSDMADDPGRTLSYKGKGKHPHPSEDESLERDRWKRRITQRKDLVEVYHSFLVISLAPSLPASLRNFPVKYNIIMRLWTYGFFKLLEDLRRASFTLGSRIALEHLQDFIIYSYTFYTNLLEEETLHEFRSGWLEALGDLARFQAAISALITSHTAAHDSEQLTSANLSSLAPPSSTSLNATPNISRAGSPMPAAEVSARPPSPSLSHPDASIGLAAARLLELEPDREMWRRIAKDWYGMGLADQPGAGKLHHHLGLLCREAVSDGVSDSAKVELRGIYHFVKSMTTLHSFPLSRESVLPLWAPNLQQKRQRKNASALELFALAHGMLFTNIQLDDFDRALPQLVAKLEDATRALQGDDRIELREWAMIAVITIGSVQEYGRGSRKPSAAPDAMDVDEAPVDVDSLPPSYLSSLKLMSAILSVVLRHPTRKANPFARSTLNPYLVMILTFLCTILKNPPAPGAHTGCLSTPAGQQALERAIPWTDLATFFAVIPRAIMSSQGMTVASSGGDVLIKKRVEAEETWAMLTSGCAPPLPEDWCMRGMEWVGRRVFERGYWKNITGEHGKGVEGEFLSEQEPGWDQGDGIVEDDNEESSQLSEADEKLKKRWVRVLRCAAGIAAATPGFRWVQGTREWRIEGELEQKLERWAEEDEAAALEQSQKRTANADDEMDVDNEVADEESDDEDSELDSEEVKALKARRRYLKNLLSTAAPPARQTPRHGRPSSGDRLTVVQPGYSVLVMDTNILLSSLSLFTTLVESKRWTVVVPLPVIMELDGLAQHDGQLGITAKAAAAYISDHMRTHGLSLKVQTSRGNYLNNLNVRREDIDFGSERTDLEKNMDDLILRTALAHEDQWMDRSGMLKTSPSGTINPGSGEPAKVVLLTLDRNLRLKARSRFLPAAGVKDIAAIFAEPSSS